MKEIKKIIRKLEIISFRRNENEIVLYNIYGTEALIINYDNDFIKVETGANISLKKLDKIAEIIKNYEFYELMKMLKKIL